MGQLFSNLPKCNPSQSSPVLSIHAPSGFPVFCLSSSIALNRYFHMLVNSMTIWSVLKLPKIAWPSPFNRHLTKNTTATATKTSPNREVFKWEKQRLCKCVIILGSFLCRRLQMNNVKWPVSKFLLTTRLTSNNFVFLFGTERIRGTVRRVKS